MLRLSGQVMWIKSRLYCCQAWIHSNENLTFWKNTTFSQRGFGHAYCTVASLCGQRSLCHCNSSLAILQTLYFWKRESLYYSRSIVKQSCDEKAQTFNIEIQTCLTELHWFRKGWLSETPLAPIIRPDSRALHALIAGSKASATILTPMLCGSSIQRLRGCYVK